MPSPAAARVGARDGKWRNFELFSEARGTEWQGGVSQAKSRSERIKTNEGVEPSERGRRHRCRSRPCSTAASVNDETAGPRRRNPRTVSRASLQLNFGQRLPLSTKDLHGDQVCEGDRSKQRAASGCPGASQSLHQGMRGGLRGEAKHGATVLAPRKVGAATPEIATAAKQAVDDIRALAYLADCLLAIRPPQRSQSVDHGRPVEYGITISGTPQSTMPSATPSKSPQFPSFLRQFSSTVVDSDSEPTGSRIL